MLLGAAPLAASPLGGSIGDTLPRAIVVVPPLALSLTLLAPSVTQQDHVPLLAFTPQFFAPRDQVYATPPLLVFTPQLFAPTDYRQHVVPLLSLPLTVFVPTHYRVPILTPTPPVTWASAPDNKRFTRSEV